MMSSNLVLEFISQHYVSAIVEVEVEVDVYTRDLKKRIRKPGISVAQRVGGVRGSVKAFSAASRRKMAFFLRNTPVSLGIHITLTYPEVFPRSGRETKAHLNKMLTWARRHGVKGMWYLEFDGRGAPHYHLYINCRVDANAVRKQWSRILAGYLQEGQQARVRIQPITRKEMVGYAVKKKKKEEQKQKQVPQGFTDVGRFWGTFNMPKLEPVTRIVGTAQEIAPVIRAVKRGVSGRCKKFPRRLDRGWNSFTLYNAAKFFNAYQKQKEALDCQNWEVTRLEEKFRKRRADVPEPLRESIPASISHYTINGPAGCL